MAARASALATATAAAASVPPPTPPPLDSRGVSDGGSSSTVMQYHAEAQRTALRTQQQARGSSTLSGVGERGLCGLVDAGRRSTAASAAVAAAGSGAQHSCAYSSGWGCEGAELDADDAATAATAVAGLPAGTGSSSSGTGGENDVATQQPASSLHNGQARVTPAASLLSELGARVDDAVRLQPLGRTAANAIVAQQLEGAAAVARTHGVMLQVEPQAVEWLAAAGFSPTSGARPLAQLVRRYVLVPLAAAIMQHGSSSSGDSAGSRDAAAAADTDGTPSAVAVVSLDAGPGLPAALTLRFRRL